jgi:hypothetical protein
MGQERGQTKIASGWPPSFHCFSRHTLTPGRLMSTNHLQAFLSQPLATSTASRRRSVPPSLPEPLSQLLNQRWRGRTHCPARRVTRGGREGVVHAIVGRVGCRSLRFHVAEDKDAARVHIFVSRFAGRMRPTHRTEISSCASPAVPAGTSRLRPDSRIAPSRVSCWRRARCRQCSSLCFDPAIGRACGH